jgi:hypothetical protein
VGQARRNRTRLQRMQAEQPWCVYCGGTTQGTSVDHMPPNSVFDNRYRLDGLLFLACEDCHSATRPLDQVAGFLCRAYPGPISPLAKAEVPKIIRGLRNNVPEVWAELAPSRRQLEDAARAGEVLGDRDAGVLNIGEKTHSLLLRFAARAVFALHYHRCGQIVPPAGAAYVRWHTNESLIDDTYPADFADILPLPQSLQQGALSQVDQFTYSSNALPDKRVSAHQLTFRLSFAIQAWVFIDIGEWMTRLRHVRHELVFRPGFLKSPS